MANCTFDAGDPSRFPYLYRDEAGNTILNGTPVVSGSSTVCIFETSTCRTNSSCCSETQAQVQASSNFYVPVIFFMMGYAAYMIGLKHRRSRVFWGIDGKKGNHANNAMVPKEVESLLSYLTEQDWALNSLCYKCAVGMVFFMLGIVYFGSIFMTVMESVVMPKSIQDTLAPADRSAQLAIKSFITPVQEIFQFIEDTMLIKVGYAIAAHRYDEINVLLHVGVIGGFFSALLAFGICLIIVFVRPAAVAMINPSYASNEILINEGCDLVPSTDSILTHASLYWILMTASWIPNFSTLPIFGFLVGSGHIFPYLLATIIQGVVPITVWFSLIGTKVLPLHALGFAYSLPQWILGLSFIGYFVCNRSLRREFRLRWAFGSCCKGTKVEDIEDEDNELNDEDMPSADVDSERAQSINWRSIASDVLRGGVQLMIVDLAVQLSLTISIYVAASQDVMTSYKLAAAQAAYWNVGPSYLIGVSMVLRLIGSRLMGAGRARSFALNFFCVLVMTLFMAVGAIVLSFMDGIPIAFDYGSSACVFASMPGCASVYAGIFSGDDSLQQVILKVFGPTAALQMLFTVLRGGLATMHDFEFMAWSSSACFVIAFVPSILVARYVFSTAISYFVAMYAPHFLMIIVFGYRVWTHLRNIRRGMGGPWTKHANSVGVNRTGEKRESTPLLG